MSEKEPVTPFTVIRGTQCPGTSGSVGPVAAQNILDALAKAGFVIVETGVKR
jgi:hypothetical protein